MDMLRKISGGWLIAAVLQMAVISVEAADEENPPLAQVTLLGIELATANLNQVREQLWDIGGFMQARSTVRQRNIDKFFTWSRIRDSYYVEFRYNNSGNVTSVKRLYRPYSIEHQNRRSAITTDEVAEKLSADLGQPFMARKGWGGSLSYSSYRWEDDKIQVLIDREGGEQLGNVFVQYTIKEQSPYAVAQKD